MKEIGRNRELFEKIDYRKLENGVYLLKVDISDMEGDYNNNLNVNEDSDVVEFVLIIKGNKLYNKDIEEGMIEFNDNEEEKDKISMFGMLDLIMDNYSEYVNWCILYKY